MMTNNLLGFPLSIILLISLCQCKKLDMEDGESLGVFTSDHSFFQADEALTSSGGHLSSPQKCVPIPRNMSLCNGIGYEEMLIPNLLDHETVREAMEESANWLPLANIKCHEHTRLFLCSLLAPLCPMQQPQLQIDTLSTLAAASHSPPPSDIILSSSPVNIYPCRSLCEAVKSACQGVMQKHGFPWPEILSCSRFPLDNDMCITPYAHSQMTTVSTSTTLMTTTLKSSFRTRKSGSRWNPRQKTTSQKPTTVPFVPTTSSTTVTVSDICEMCNTLIQPAQLDSLFCQADFVGKVRFRRLTRRGVFLAKRPKVLKVSHLASQNVSSADFISAKSVEFFFDPERSTVSCRRTCADKVELKSQLYLVVGHFIQRAPEVLTRRSSLPQIAIRLVLPWFAGPNNRDFRQAEKRLQNLKCGSKTGKKEAKIKG